MQNPFTFSEYPFLKEINPETARQIYVSLQNREKMKAITMYMEFSKCDYEDADNIIDDLETEMIRKNEIPNLSRFYTVFLTCGMCKNTKPMRKGYIFHFTDDWLHMRLFICNRCISKVAVQRTHHELCYECFKDLPNNMLSDKTKSSFGILSHAEDVFEKSHSPIFDELPASTDEEFQYPGSCNVDFKAWLKEHVPKQLK